MSGQSSRQYRLFLILILCGSLLVLTPTPTVNATSSTYGLELVSEDVMLQPTTYPTALYVPQVNCTFFVYMKGIYWNPPANYEFYAKKFNHTSKTMGSEVHIGTSVGTDRHFAPSLAYLPNGSLVYFYDSHSGVPTYISYRVSTAAWSIDSWNAQQTFDGDFAYPNPVCFSDKMVLFIRNSTWSGGQGVEWLRYDFDNTHFFANRTQIVEDYAGCGWYATWHREGDKIVVGGHLCNVTGGGKSYNIYYAESLDKGVTWKAANGTSLSLPLGENAKAIDVGWDTGYVYYPFAVYNKGNFPQVFVTRATTDVDESYHWLGVGYYQGSSWTYKNVVNADNQVLNWTREGESQIIYPFRDGSFNITTFWALTLGDPETRRVARYVQSEYDLSVFAQMLTTNTLARAGIFEGVANHEPPYEAFIDIWYGDYDPDHHYAESGYLAYNNAAFLYTFKGKYDEDTGELFPLSTRAVNVTAYFSDGTASEPFELNGTYFYGSASKPLYFYLNTSEPREYWLDVDDIVLTIYVFDSTLTSYTIRFDDLAGALHDHPFITIQRIINGTLMTVDKRKVDVEDKIVSSLKQGTHYTIVISDGASYTFGDLLMTSDTSIGLTLKGIEFPQDVIIAYQYVRIYAERYANFSTIKVTYQDTEGDLADVQVRIYFENETVAASANYTDTTAFSYTWLNAQYNETYTARVIIDHSQYGTMNYNSIMYRGGYNVRPWSIPIGSIPNMNTADIIPMFILGGCFLIFSKANAYVSGFFAVGVAAIMGILGWVSIPASMIIAAFVVVVLLAFVYSKRRTYY